MPVGKIVLLGTVFLSSSYIGLSIAWRLKRRMVALKAVSAMVRRMQSMLIHMGYTLVQAIHALADREGYDCYGVAAAMVERLEQHTDTLSEVWRESWVQRCGADRNLSALLPDDLDLIYMLGDRLGVDDLAAQERLLGYVLDELEIRTRAATDESKVKGKMARNMGMLLGLGIMILMW